MRELILKMSMSVDGFVSDLDGRNRWMFGADQEAKAWSVAAISNASLHIMGSFARSLVAHGLVDQFVLLVAPVALGKDQPLFSELAAPMPLKLVSSKAFPGGAVAQTYRAM